jgi:hypothetical protein
LYLHVSHLPWKDRLPVYGPNGELLQFVSLKRAQELIEAGHVIPVGTKQRINKLIAHRGSEEFLRATGPRRPKQDTHNHETNDNPRGVWTFRKQVWARHVL